MPIQSYRGKPWEEGEGGRLDPRRVKDIKYLPASAIQDGAPITFYIGKMNATQMLANF